MTVPAAIDSDALLAKSKVYVRRALDRKDAGDLDEYQLWSSLALELLGKATLARVHPCLVADPTHAPSLFAAAGKAYSTDIKTITAKTLFIRLGQLSTRFDAGVGSFCISISERRNAELHSGDVPFRAMKLDAWENRYWHAADVVLKMQNSTLADWLGADRSDGPARIVEHAAQARRSAAELRLETAKATFNSLKKKEREDLLGKAAARSIVHYPDLFQQHYDATWSTTCPACEGKAYSAGEQIDEIVIEPDHEYGSAWEIVEQTLAPEEFRCPICEFYAEGYEELKATALDGLHVLETEREIEYEPDYGND